MRNYIIKIILNSLLKKSCIEQVSKLGKDERKKSCYHIRLYKNNNIIMFVQKVTNSYFEGVINNGTKYVATDNINLKYIKLNDIRITHRLKENNIYYHSLLNFIFLGLTKLRIFELKIKLIFDKTNQYIYNKRKLVLKDRLFILRLLINHYLTTNEKGLDILTIMSKIYTTRFILHPSEEKLERKLKLLLNSFVFEGDLKIEKMTYVITEKAIVTLENFEKAKKKIYFENFIKVIMIILTFILALASVFKYIYPAKLIIDVILNLGQPIW